MSSREYILDQGYDLLEINPTIRGNCYVAAIKPSHNPSTFAPTLDEAIESLAAIIRSEREPNVEHLCTGEF